MAVNTILLDFSFSVNPSLKNNDSALSLLSSNIEKVLGDFLPGLKVVHDFSFGGSLVKTFTADRGALVNLRIFTNGIITLNIDYFKEDTEDPLISLHTCYQLERDIKLKVAEIKTTRTLPSIKRGFVPTYFLTSDERLLEYDIDSLVFDKTTPYQKVQIVHSKTLGNMLVLDDLQNISEADLIYTETLMQRGKENYENKEIVILGGGDGALLYELLKEKPKQVVMLELDEVVMKACSKHMRSICGDVLDNYKGPHYEIVVGDCLKFLDQYVLEGRKFDYVFGDLTDVPISTDNSQDLWSFIVTVLELSFKVLKPDGKFMTHVTGLSVPEAIETYKQYLKKMNPPVTFTMDKAFVPSFLEQWAFCQVSLANQKSIQE